MEDPRRRAVLSLVAGGLAVAGVNAALKASDERYAAFGSSGGSNSLPSIVADDGRCKGS